jgi:pyridoxal phosphate enzyme (YggS family)
MTMTSSECRIDENYRRVRERMAAACARAGRDPAAVTLVAVTKYAEIEWARRLVALGAVELGENRPQQLVQRAAQITAPVRWHLIGPLQRNKVRSILPLASLIHSADSLRLLQAIDRIGGELGLRPRVLLEVNLSGEAEKHGFLAEELLTAWKQLPWLPNLQIEGLMTMAGWSPDAENARPAFRALRELRDELRSRSGSTTCLEHLSMGMTGDFEVAIEEGATLVRIGSALWEGLKRPPHPKTNGDEDALSPPSEGGGGGVP